MISYIKTVIKPRIFISLSCSVLVLLLSCKEEVKEEEIDYKYTNALIEETSPYLLQHAHNPVNWRPWSQDALEEAQKESKLVLISIGYSSCHWCHVMEEETFADEEVAKMMNENFINIKIDREERPDLDQLYMTALQLMTGKGGWPLNIIAMPDGKPLYGGTYHTKEEWNRVLSQIHNIYLQDPEKAQEYANNVANGVQEVNLIETNEGAGELNREKLEESIVIWKENWDTKWGGDLGSQKFMLPVNIEFLLNYYVLIGDDEVEAHLKRTLDNIALKGVYDHIEGGFFRYSTDEKWELPHFEKMLYDNAQLIDLYSKAYKVFKDPLYKQVVIETIEFLEKRMKNPEGGYYSSLDADYKGEEGGYYLWKEEELKKIVEKDYELFASYYNVNTASELKDEKLHLYKKLRDSNFVAQNQISEKDLYNLKNGWVDNLQEARSQRALPRIDDKIITSWNSMLIIGMLEAYTIFENDSYLERAISTFETLKSKAFLNGKLVHSFKPNSKINDGFLEDYAFLEKASLKLYSITLDEQYLKFAEELNEIVTSEFSDEESIMFTYNNHEKLISKIIKTNDGIQPSANAVMAENLLILGHFKYNNDYLQKTRNMVTSMMPFLSDNPANYSMWNSNLFKLVFPYYEIAVVGNDADKLINVLNQNYFPNILIVGTRKPSDYPLFEKRFVAGETYIYVCEGRTCKRPVKTVDEALEQLRLDLASTEY